MGVLGWARTPAQNAVADSAIAAQDGASARSFPVSLRAVMASARRLADDQGGALKTSGDLNAYGVATGSGVTELRAGISLLTKVHRTNTAEATLNVDGLGPLPWVDAGGVPLKEGRLIEGRFYASILDTLADGSAVAWRVQAGASTLDEIPGLGQAKADAQAAASTATTKAGEANASAAAASAKATETQGYATTATTKAGEASASAATANQRAGDAQGFAATATTKAGEASTSAANAATQVGLAAAEVGKAAAQAQTAQNAVATGRVTYDTLAQLTANLQPAAGAQGEVLADGANNGLYVKSGASGAGSWVKKSGATVPSLDVRATSVEGRASAVEAVTTNFPAPPANPRLTPRVLLGLQDGVLTFDAFGRFSGVPTPGFAAKLAVSTQVTQTDATAWDGLVARIDPTTLDRFILRSWEGREFLARQLRASTTGTAVFARMARASVSKLAPMANFGGQSNNGPAGGKISIDALAPHLSLMPSNAVNQITGSNKYTASVVPTDLVPNQDGASFGGQTIGMLTAAALSFIEVQDSAPLTAKLFAASYRGGTDIELFLQANQSPESDPSGTDKVHTNYNARLLFGDIGRLAIPYDLIPWTPFTFFSQGENTTSAANWESVGGQVIDEETSRVQGFGAAAQALAVAAGQTIPVGADVRPQLILGVTATAFQTTNQNTSTIGQANLLMKQALGTSALASKVTGVPAYVAACGPRGAGVHWGWAGKMLMAEQIACAQYEIAKDPTKLFPIIRFDTVAIDGTDVVFTLTGNPYAAPANAPVNIEETYGSAFQLTDDWIDRYQPPTITKPNGDVVKTFGLSYLGASNAAVIQSVTEEWVNTGNGYLRQQFRIRNDVAPTGPWSLAYAMKPSPVPSCDTAGSTNTTGVNWDAFRGSICVRSPWRSYFRRRFGRQMQRSVIPEFMQVWMIPQAKAFV